MVRVKRLQEVNGQEVLVAIVSIEESVIRLIVLSGTGIVKTAQELDFRNRAGAPILATALPRANLIIFAN